MRAVAGDYIYAETNYANPHALTGYFNGTATTTYAYDAIGNLATTTGAATSTFMWDYRNRMIRAWVAGATSTYQYDHTIARMRQVVGSTTTEYPNRFYSLATSTQSGTGTSTAYIWHGDTLVATIEQRLVNGVASGTATTYYVHPDHLGSTNAITNSAGVVKQALDYYPYGAQRINTGMDASDRRFIGQFADDATSLDYLNARYYDPSRGGFLSQDPVFWEAGQTSDGKAALSNPQSMMNSYAYAGGNPITGKDPSGRFWWEGFYDWSGYDGWKGVGMKTQEVFGGHARAMSAIAQNSQSVGNLSTRNGVNPALVNAIIYEEQSHLTPDETRVLKREQIAPNWEPRGKDGGVGLMQVNGANGQRFGGYSKWELANNPMLNIDSGTQLMSNIQTSYNTKNPATIGTVYNGSQAYGQRINAQMNNPNYNRNVLAAGLQKLVSSLQKLRDSLK